MDEAQELHPLSQEVAGDTHAQSGIMEMNGEQGDTLTLYHTVDSRTSQRGEVKVDLAAAKRAASSALAGILGSSLPSPPSTVNVPMVKHGQQKTPRENLGPTQLRSPGSHHSTSPMGSELPSPGHAHAQRAGPSWISDSGTSGIPAGMTNRPPPPPPPRHPSARHSPNQLPGNSLDPLAVFHQLGGPPPPPPPPRSSSGSTQQQPGYSSNAYCDWGTDYQAAYAQQQYQHGSRPTSGTNAVPSSKPRHVPSQYTSQTNTMVIPAMQQNFMLSQQGQQQHQVLPAGGAWQQQVAPSSSMAQQYQLTQQGLGALSGAVRRVTWNGSSGQQLRIQPLPAATPSVPPSPHTQAVQHDSLIHLHALNQQPAWPSTSLPSPAHQAAQASWLPNGTRQQQQPSPRHQQQQQQVLLQQQLPGVLPQYSQRRSPSGTCYEALQHDELIAINTLLGSSSPALPPGTVAAAAAPSSAGALASWPELRETNLQLADGTILAVQPMPLVPPAADDSVSSGGIARAFPTEQLFDCNVSDSGVTAGNSAKNRQGSSHSIAGSTSTGWAAPASIQQLAQQLQLFSDPGNVGSSQRASSLSGTSTGRMPSSVIDASALSSASCRASTSGAVVQADGPSSAPGAGKPPQQLQQARLVLTPPAGGLPCWLTAFQLSCTQVLLAAKQQTAGDAVVVDPAGTASQHQQVTHEQLLAEHQLLLALLTVLVRCDCGSTASSDLAVELLMVAAAIQVHQQQQANGTSFAGFSAGAQLGFHLAAATMEARVRAPQTSPELQHAVRRVRQLLPTEEDPPGIVALNTQDLASLAKLTSRHLAHLSTCTPPQLSRSRSTTTTSTTTNAAAHNYPAPGSLHASTLLQMQRLALGSSSSARSTTNGPSMGELPELVPGEEEDDGEGAVWCGTGTAVTAVQRPVMMPISPCHMAHAGGTLSTTPIPAAIPPVGTPALTTTTTAALSRVVDGGQAQSVSPSQRLRLRPSLSVDISTAWANIHEVAPAQYIGTSNTAIAAAAKAAVETMQQQQSSAAPGLQPQNQTQHYKPATGWSSSTQTPVPNAGPSVAVVTETGLQQPSSPRGPYDLPLLSGAASTAQPSTGMLSTPASSRVASTVHLNNPNQAQLLPLVWEALGLSFSSSSSGAPPAASNGWGSATNSNANLTGGFALPADLPAGTGNSFSAYGSKRPSINNELPNTSNSFSVPAGSFINVGVGSFSTAANSFSAFTQGIVGSVMSSFSTAGGNELSFNAQDLASPAGYSFSRLGQNAGTGVTGSESCSGSAQEWQQALTNGYMPPHRQGSDASSGANLQPPSTNVSGGASASNSTHQLMMEQLQALIDVPTTTTTISVNDPSWPQPKAQFQSMPGTMESFQQLQQLQQQLQAVKQQVVGSSVTPIVPRATGATALSPVGGMPLQATQGTPWSPLSSPSMHDRASLMASGGLAGGVVAANPTVLPETATAWPSSLSMWQPSQSGANWQQQ